MMIHSIELFDDYSIIRFACMSLHATRERGESLADLARWVFDYAVPF